MQEVQSAILNKLNKLEEQFLAIGEREDHQNSAIYSALVKFQADSKIVNAKACRITWVGIEEHGSEIATHQFDKEALKEIIETSGDDELLGDLNNGKITLHRHPKIKTNSFSRLPRIIKIELRNQELRDRLLMHMRAGRLSMTKEYVHSYARKDYTKEELEYDRSLRKKAGMMNQLEGKLMYVVRDLVIHKLSVPRQLPVKSSIDSSETANTCQSAGETQVSIPTQFTR
ncbi:hypothetical protein Y032_0090g2354 [Ancylostoma ceylanicum]|uniref:Uncharacterized protein n=1 Tax=Ancylostoma ceylanicum TaxID=53326 RepID=A0A016TMW1_9BILA|nr:hypothetical protein Y032_0090g2354 [Ancylostoma ceylanicum]